MAAAAGKIWREHGAREFRECVGDDLRTKMGRPFPDLARAKRGETVVFSWIVFRSKPHGNRVHAEVMADTRIKNMMNGKDMPLDVKRMSRGGFRTLVDIAGNRRSR